MKYLLSIILFLFLSTLEARSANYITVRTNYNLGNNYQLGNQLFCVATTLSYAWDHNFIPIFPFLNEAGANRTYNRDHLFFRLDVSDRKIRKIHYDMSWRYNPLPIFQRDVKLVGPFMSWKYFHHHRKKLLEIFSPSDAITSYLNDKYAHLLSRSDTVAIHVRTVDRSTHPAIPFPGIHYFEKAMHEFPDDSLFVVFSDRINWCKVNFPLHFPERKFEFIEGNDHIQDLFLLSKMKNHILSNSTFSWWGAYLHEGEHKVCVPEIWFAPVFKSVLEDIYLPEWTVIQHDSFEEAYPEDMYLYDAASQSVDNVSTD